MFEFSLYAKLGKITKSMAMYQCMLESAKGTHAEPFVANELNHLSYDIARKLNRFYESNKLFREFVDSENPTFLNQKYMELLNNTIDPSEWKETLVDIVGIIGLGGTVAEKMAVVHTFDAEKTEYRELIEAYRRRRLTFPEQSG